MKQNPCRYCVFASEYKGRHTQGYRFECRHCENIKKHREYLKNQRKFEAGEPIKTIDELLEQEWVMWGRSAKHIEFIKSMQFRFILKALENDWFCKPIRKNMEE